MDVKRTQSLTDQITLVVRVCVAVKRKLQFWYWKRDELLEFAPDIELNDVPKVLCWSGNLICVGYKTEYVLFDVSQNIILLFYPLLIYYPNFIQRFLTKNERKLIYFQQVPRGQMRTLVLLLLTRRNILALSKMNI